MSEHNPHRFELRDLQPVPLEGGGYDFILTLVGRGHEIKLRIRQRNLPLQLAWRDTNTGPWLTHRSAIISDRKLTEEEMA